MPVTLRVHVWHITVNTGDAAIHLLVDESATPQAEVKRAVLIDGGKTTKAEELLAAIAKINASYQFDENANFDGVDKDGDVVRSLRFDSIVITHWYRAIWHARRRIP
jgi:hypothetical protein